MLRRFLLPALMALVACGPAVDEAEADGNAEAEVDAGGDGDDPVDLPTDLPSDLPPDAEEPSPPESWVGGFYDWGFEEELQIGVDVEHGGLYASLEHLEFMGGREVEMRKEDCLAGRDPDRFTLAPSDGAGVWELVPGEGVHFFRGVEPLREILLEEGEACDQLVVRFVGEDGWEEQIQMVRGGGAGRLNVFPSKHWTGFVAISSIALRLRRLASKRNRSRSPSRRS